jgi:hypothetical protein
MTIAEGQDFEIRQGDKLPIDFTITEADGETARDVTGASFSWSVAKTRGAAALIEKDDDSGGGIVAIDLTIGRIRINLLAVDTEDLEGAYLHELVMTLDSLGPVTVAVGTLYVRHSIFK